MENDIRHQIDKFKNFIWEAVETKCQTKGAIFKTTIKSDNIQVKVEIPFDLKLNEKEAKLLEDNLHNAIELVLKPYFK